MEENPNYYAIIPATIRYDKRLTPNAKLLYAEITSLCNMNGKCFATNDYFAKLYGVSKVSISKWIKELVDCCYIKSEIVYKEGSKEIEGRYLTFVEYPIKEIFNTPIKEKFKDNNNTTNVVYNNNTLTESNIRGAMEKWLAYKKERKEKYTPSGLDACIKRLERLSGNDSDIAMQIVEESMANNYAGLFALKEKQTQLPSAEQEKADFLKKWNEAGV